jgi:26S proteasome regulatory subunit N1
LKGVTYEIEDIMVVGNEDKKELLQEIVNNSKLSEGYLTLARDLDVMEPKTPEDIYKVGYFSTLFVSELILYDL